MDTRSFALSAVVGVAVVAALSLTMFQLLD
jgi:hypothetical protein